MPKPAPDVRKRIEEDPGYRAAFVIFDFLETIGKDCWSFVHVNDAQSEMSERHGTYIGFDEMNIDVMSHGEQLLIHAAWSLFNGEKSLRLDEICSTLDWESYDAVIAAMNAYRPERLTKAQVFDRLKKADYRMAQADADNPR